MARPLSAWERRDTILVLTIFAAAFLLRLIYLLQYRSCPYFAHEGMDAGYNAAWAEAMAAGRRFLDGPYFRAPFYPIVLAGLFKATGGSYFAARLAQMAIGSLSCVLLYAIARPLFGRTLAAVAAFAAAAYATLIYFDGELLDAGLGLFLNLGALALLLRWQRSPGLPGAAGAGLLLGLSAITRPNILLFVPIVLVWIFWQRKQPGRRAATAAAFVAAVLLPILPVAVRNLTAGGDRVLIASQGGLNLYIGNNPEAPGTVAYVPGLDMTVQGVYEESARLAQEETGRALKPSEVSDFYTRRALRFMTGQPGRAIALLAKKAAAFWTRVEIPDNRNASLLIDRYGPVLRALPLGFWLVGPLAMAGLVAIWPRRRELFLVWAYLLAYMASVVLFFVTSRYRVPVVPILILLAVVGAAAWIAAIRARAWKKIAAFAGAALFAILISQSVIGSPGVGTEPPEIELVDLSRVLMELGRPQEGIQMLEEALRANPRYAQAIYSMGLTFQILGQPEKAVERYRQALEIDPGHVSSLNNLGKMLMQTGRAADALPYFERAVAAEPRHANARFNLGEAYARVRRYREAIAEFERGLALERGRPDIFVHIAFLSSAIDQPGLLDCERGRRAAEEAVRLTGGREHYPLYALAAALASCGEFGRAEETITRAIEIAKAAGDRVTTATMEKQRENYRSGRPTRWSREPEAP